MAFCITIDRLDANIEETTVGRWLKAEGDTVALGEPVVEIITDKITFEYESEAAGVLRKIVAPEKSVVPVHYVLGVIAEADEPLPDYESRNAALVASLAEEQRASAVRAVPARRADPSDGKRVRATPAARRRARELGVDLAEIAQDIDGAVSLEDVERYAAEH